MHVVFLYDKMLELFGSLTLRPPASELLGTYWLFPGGSPTLGLQIWITKAI